MIEINDVIDRPPATKQDIFEDMRMALAVALYKSGTSAKGVDALIAKWRRRYEEAA